MKPSDSLYHRLFSHPLMVEQLVDAVARWFRDHPDYGTLRLLFTELVRQALVTVSRTVPLPDDLQEMQTMLATQGQRWIEKWTAQGQISGKASVLRRMLTRRFGPLPEGVDARTLDEVFGGGSAG